MRGYLALYRLISSPYYAPCHVRQVQQRTGRKRSKEDFHRLSLARHLMPPLLKSTSIACRWNVCVDPRDLCVLCVHALETVVDGCFAVLSHRQQLISWCEEDREERLVYLCMIHILPLPSHSLTFIAAEKRTRVKPQSLAQWMAAGEK